MDVGTPSFMAPELLSETPEKFDEKIDVWPVGMVLFEMLAGRNYYKGINNNI
jgi:serine/threonine protein kinase